MPAQVKSLFGRVTGAVKEFSLPQRTFALIAVAALVLGGIALANWASKPTMSPLFSGLSATDASAVVDQLNAEGVQYQLTDGGATVMVPNDQLYSMRLKLAAAGLPANEDGDGYSLLDGMSMTSSEFQQQTTYQRAIEGELAKTISAMQGVDSASVKLALPTDSVFVSEKQDPTASVFIRTKTGTELSTDQVEAIVHLVSAGIEGMKATDVAVIDASGQVLSAVGTGVAGASGNQTTTDYENRVTSAVQALLDQVLGTGKSAVTMTADLDYDQTQRTTEEFSAAEGVPPLISSTTTEEYSGTGSGTATGVLGPDNIAVPTGDATSGDGSYTSTSEDVNNAVNKVTEVTQQAPGSVRRQSLAVAVDTTAAAGIDMAQLTEMLSAAAGIDTTRGDTIAVQRMAFDTTGADAAASALAAADAETAAAARQSLIRQAAIAGALLLLVIVVAVVLARRSRRARREALDIGELTTVMEPPADLPELEEPADIPPALPGPAEVDPVAESLAVKRAEISALADEQPAEVADLLRGWMSNPAGRR